MNFLSCGGDVLVEFETFYAVVIPLSGKVASRVSQRACVAPERAPLRFESPMDVGGYAMSWYRLLRVMIDELDRSGSLLNYVDALDRTNLREVRVRGGGAEGRGDR